MDRNQKQAYGLRRLTKACDRKILATSSVEQENCEKWIALWARVAGIKAKEVGS